MRDGQRHAKAGGGVRRGAALIPVSTMALLLLWPAPATRIYAMAVGTTAGMIAELAVLGAALKSRGMALLPRRRSSSPASRQVVAQTCRWPQGR